MNRLKTFLIVSGMLFSLSAMAGESGIIKVNHHPESGYSVLSIINNQLNYNTLEVICNSSGQTLMNDRIKNQASYQKLLDFKELEDGSYTAQISGDNELIL
ncbi:hypothetical protein [Carboxylicivirga marina]|uniref:Secretion system C-terminal sorting domain-containing protein n=1 Tax=Carboxylicivirga marina TaxID=2800988 RepID=A0ABS1HQK1_9BACT|nr:hypothetical protein [Carboxylicivirga marina]MBK3519851.1 hypothetical protein [Carboxylicivirga marina]